MVVVTGCDTGIGKELVKVLLRKGCVVAASYLETNPFPKDPRIHVRKMDLRKPAEVEEFCRFAKDLCNRRGVRLKAVVANAGVALGGPVEDLPMDIYRESFEINFFGTVAVVQAMIPQLERDKGRILVVGSLAGRIAMPFLSPYAASKHALEGFCDSLRREMKPWGVETILVEPAAVATPIWNKAKRQDTSFVQEKYKKSLQRFKETFVEGGNAGMDPAAAAARIGELLWVKKPRDRYIVAKDKARSRLLLLVSRSLLDKGIVKKYMEF
nr:SDR family NAD(P)-dependent oxidoreductase [Anaerotalea alkaliphila]